VLDSVGLAHRIRTVLTAIPIVLAANNAVPPTLPARRKQAGNDDNPRERQQRAGNTQWHRSSPRRHCRPRCQPRLSCRWAIRVGDVRRRVGRVDVSAVRAVVVATVFIIGLQSAKPVASVS
jgi:hypothetical protein